jgi:hypothetical protein
VYLKQTSLSGSHGFPICDAEAVPKRILELMGVQGLTRENVASHLQVQIKDKVKIQLHPGCKSGFIVLHYFTICTIFLCAHLAMMQSTFRRV